MNESTEQKQVSRNRFARAAKIVLIGLLAVTLVTLLVMNLWNWLLPALFGFKAIGFWQTLGLLVLSRIFFGGFRGPGRHMPWRRRMMERWEQMTPEEREKFRQGLRHRCGEHHPTEARA